MMLRRMSAGMRESKDRLLLSEEKFRVGKGSSYRLLHLLDQVTYK